ncbi:MAG: hypothetical protein GYA23_03360 [Methanomicrobiales archaeon]|nr:hypothetical protein [Methanomicrobiales archaeon]
MSALGKTMPEPGKTLQDHFAVVFFAAALLCAAAEIVIWGTPLVETVLAWILLVNIGVQGLLAGVSHWYEPSAKKVAEKLGWAPGSPFQREVAAADAAFGVLGILAFFIRDNFLVATVIGASVMLFLMGIGHVLDLRKNQNDSVYNAGTVVWFDLLLPVLMCILLVMGKAGW